MSGQTPLYTATIRQSPSPGWQLPPHAHKTSKLKTPIGLPCRLLKWTSPKHPLAYPAGYSNGLVQTLQFIYHVSAVLSLGGGAGCIGSIVDCINIVY